MLPAIEKLVKNLKPKYDDDVIDRLNYAYTSSFFVLLILVIGAKQYVGEPLQCWMSAEFKTNWEKYIEHYCFVENTYYVSFEQDRLPAEHQREKYELQYYQWVPVVLVLQLLLFLAPKTFWGAVSWKTGLSVNALIGQLSHADRQKKILTHRKGKNDEHSEAREIARQMREITKFNGLRTNRLFCFIPTGARNHYFTTMYLLYKFLNLVNTGLQLWVMNIYLNTDEHYALWGWDIISDLWDKREWRSSGRFPRVTYCDFMRRDDTSSRPMTFTVQCVLMINMFNEKLYVILWFWFSALTILNLLNLIYWLIMSFVDACKTYFIEAQLSFADVKDYKDADIPKFIEHWLTMDGLTAIRLISANAGDLVSSDIVAELYHDFCNSTDKDGKKGLEEAAAKCATNSGMKPEKDGNILEGITYHQNANAGPQRVHPAPPPPPSQPPPPPPPQHQHQQHPPTEKGQQIPHAPIEEEITAKTAAPSSAAAKPSAAVVSLPSKSRSYVVIKGDDAPPVPIGIPVYPDLKSVPDDAVLQPVSMKKEDDIASVD